MMLLRRHSSAEPRPRVDLPRCAGGRPGSCFSPSGATPWPARCSSRGVLVPRRARLLRDLPAPWLAHAALRSLPVAARDRDPALAADPHYRHRPPAPAFTVPTDTYAYVLLALWTYDPMVALRQVAATLVVWGHACIGLHYWLRLKSWYGRTRPWLYAGALLLPAFSLLGFVSAGRAVSVLNEEPGWRQSLLADVNAPGPEVLTTFLAIEQWDADRARGPCSSWCYAARGVRGRGREAAPPHHRALSGDRATSGSPPAPASSKRAGRAASRMRPFAADAAAARRAGCASTTGRRRCRPRRRRNAKSWTGIGVPPNVRLACQLRPVADVSVTPLLPPNVGPRDGLRAGGRRCRVRSGRSPVLFADIRGFTGLSEAKLPLRCRLRAQPLLPLDGGGDSTRPAAVSTKFIGDGIMALFGNRHAAGGGRRTGPRRGKGDGGGARRPEPAARIRPAGAVADRHRHPYRAGHRRRDGLRGGGLGDRDRRYGQHGEAGWNR